MVCFEFLKRKLAYGVAFALLVGLSPAAHAAPLFSFSDSPTPASITSGDADSDDSSIKITGGSGIHQNANYSLSGINELIMTITLTGGDDQLVLSGTTVNFALTITDEGSSTSYTIPYTGTLSGSLGIGSITSLMLSSVTPLSPTTFDLGAYAYTVKLTDPNYLVPGPNLVNVNVNAVPLAVPEPASLTLWGAVGLVGAWYGRRKLQRKVAL